MYVLPIIAKGKIVEYSATMFSLFSTRKDQCAYSSHGCTCQRNDIDKICKVVECKNNKWIKSCHEVPKFVKGVKMQMEGNDQPDMIWISFWGDKKIVCNIGMVRFHVSSIS